MKREYELISIIKEEEDKHEQKVIETFNKIIKYFNRNNVRVEKDSTFYFELERLIVPNVSRSLPYNNYLSLLVKCRYRSLKKYTDNINKHFKTNNTVVNMKFYNDKKVVSIEIFIFKRGQMFRKYIVFDLTDTNVINYKRKLKLIIKRFKDSIK